MNINSLKGTNAANALTAPTQNQNRTPSSIPPAGAQSAASTNISGPGQLFSRLSQLAQQDPAKFKEVAQSIADKLHSAAQQGSGKQADFESKLADRFAQAAQSGDMSALQPPGGRGAEHAHHHHHHGGGGGGGAGSAMGDILSSALDQVNQALSATTDAASTANAAATSDNGSGSSG